MTTKAIAYKGKKVFIGIDVHKSFYVLSAICEEQLVKRARMEAKPLVVALNANRVLKQTFRRC